MKVLKVVGITVASVVGMVGAALVAALFIEGKMDEGYEPDYQDRSY